jgi:hypothetical protein
MGHRTVKILHYTGIIIIIISAQEAAEEHVMAKERGKMHK